MNNMKESVINLKFLNTPMVDKPSSEKWETCINAKGPQLEIMSTEQLYVQVRVNAERMKPVEPTSNEIKAFHSELRKSINALVT